MHCIVSSQKCHCMTIMLKVGAFDDPFLLLLLIVELTMLLVKMCIDAKCKDVICCAGCSEIRALSLGTVTATVTLSQHSVPGGPSIPVMYLNIDPMWHWMPSHQHHIVQQRGRVHVVHSVMRASCVFQGRGGGLARGFLLILPWHFHSVCIGQRAIGGAQYRSCVGSLFRLADTNYSFYCIVQSSGDGVQEAGK